MRHPHVDSAESRGAGAVGAEVDAERVGGQRRGQLAERRVDGRIQVDRLGPLGVGEGHGLESTRRRDGNFGGTGEEQDERGDHN